jgi:hypothetical protein
MSDLELVFICTTYNPMASLRWDLLEQTMASARVAFPGCLMVLADKLSDDGSWEAQRELACRHCAHIANGHTKGHQNHSPGMARTIAWDMMPFLLPYSDPDKTILVFSDDDMLWSPSAKEWILSFWQNPPPDVAILCAYLEPDFSWNKPREVIDTGHVRALVRDSAPGAAWTFPMSMGKFIFPVPMTFGYDYKTCLKLAMMGKRVAQIDLCEHMGWEASTHGNDANLYAKPIDKARWGL